MYYDNKGILFYSEMSNLTEESKKEWEIIGYMEQTDNVLKTKKELDVDWKIPRIPEMFSSWKGFIENILIFQWHLVLLWC